MKTENMVIALAAAAALGGAYYFFIYKPKHAALPAGQPGAATFPTGQPPVQTPAPAQSLPGIPAGLPSPTPVTVTQSFQAADLTTGLIKVFSPGDQVLVYGVPVAGITTFTDATSHLYTTQSAVAGNLARRAA